MRRREFLWVLGTGIAATPLLGQTQQVIPMVGVVGEWSSTEPETLAEPFLSHMKELGWEDGRNYRALFLYTERHTDRDPVLVGELLARGVDVVVVFGNSGIKAAQRATNTVPIVGMADDMVKSGLAASMARPGSNTTGVSILASELDVKRLQLLHDAIPEAKRIGVLADPTTISTQAELIQASVDLKLELVVFTARNREEVVQSLEALQSSHLDGINVLASPILAGWFGLINERLTQAHLPGIYQWPEASEAGGFLAYGPRMRLCMQNLAELVTKILGGARPENLPVEQPTKFDLVVNLKTARQIGVSVPAALLHRADEVID